CAISATSPSAPATRCALTPRPRALLATPRRIGCWVERIARALCCPRRRSRGALIAAGRRAARMAEALEIHTIVSMPFAENTYVVWRHGREDAVVIDPGLEPESILDFLREQGLKPALVLNTHGHADHIAGNEAMKE